MDGTIPQADIGELVSAKDKIAKLQAYVDATEKDFVKRLNEGLGHEGGMFRLSVHENKLHVGRA